MISGGGGDALPSFGPAWVQNLCLPDERSNRERSCRIGFHSVYLVCLKAYRNMRSYTGMICTRIYIGCTSFNQT